MISPQMNCRICKQPILPPKRATVTDTCMTCGHREATRTTRTVVPGHKQGYMLVTNRAELIGMNNKGGNNRC